MPQPHVLSRAKVRELDRRAIEEFGIPSFTLMENAARACADEAERLLRLRGVQREMNRLEKPGSRDDIPRNLDELERWKSGLAYSEHPTVVLCGPGNNGGDGMAIARTLFNRGHEVRVYLAGPPACLEAASPDVQHNARLLAALGIELKPVHEASAAAEDIAQTDLIVDAIFGTGLTRALTEPWLSLVQLANASGATKLAVDIPSGLDADTGEILGAAVRADVTVTFVAIKPGFLVNAGPATCGRVQLAEIGIPRAMIEQAAV